MQTALFDEADTGLLKPNIDFEKKKEKDNNKGVEQSK